MDDDAHAAALAQLEEEERLAEEAGGPAPPTDADMKDEKMAPAPSHQTIEKCRAMTLTDIAAVDAAIVEKGMALFFSNHYSEAEALFKTAQGDDPLVAACLAVLYTMRALLSMEQRYVNQSCAYLLFASHFAKEVLPPKKGLVAASMSKLSGWFKRGGGGKEKEKDGKDHHHGSAGEPIRGGEGKEKDSMTPMSAATFRAKVVMAEAEVLRGSVLLLEETFSSYVRAGFALRRAYNIYDELQRHLAAYKAHQIARGRLDPIACEEAVAELRAKTIDDAEVHVGLGNTPVGSASENTTATSTASSGSAANTTASSAALRRYGIAIDDNSYFAMHFGLGCIHITTSILPEKILKILSALGYMHDQEKGFDHMRQCLASRTLMAPLASLYMMAFHGMLPSFTPLMAPASLPAAMRVDAATRKLFPNSVIHLWVSGRVNRLAGRIPSSTSSSVEDDLLIFQQCVGEGARSSLSQALPQLKDIALYDLGWSFVARLDWRRAALCFKVLEESSMWSRCFYAYAQGVCWEMLGFAGGLLDDGGGSDSNNENHSASSSVTTTDGAPFDIDAFFASATDVPKIPFNCEQLASRCYWRAIEYKTFKLGGRELSIDQFVGARVKRMVEVGRGIHDRLIAEEAEAEAARATNAPTATGVSAQGNPAEDSAPASPSGASATFFYGSIRPNNKLLFGGEYLLKNTMMGACGFELAFLFCMITQMRHEHLASARGVVEKVLQSKMLRGVEARKGAKAQKKDGKRAEKAEAARVRKLDKLRLRRKKEEDKAKEKAAREAEEAEERKAHDAEAAAVGFNDADDDENAKHRAATGHDESGLVSCSEGGSDDDDDHTSDDGTSSEDEDDNNATHSTHRSHHGILSHGGTTTTTASSGNDTSASASPNGIATIAANTSGVGGGGFVINSPSWSLGATPRYKRHFRAANVGLREDMAAVSLLYATICRELLKTAPPLISASASSAQQQQQPPQQLSYTYDDVMTMYRQIAKERTAEDDAAVAAAPRGRRRFLRLLRRGDSPASSAPPANAPDAPQQPYAHRPTHPKTGLVVVPPLLVPELGAAAHSLRGGRRVLLSK